MIRNRVAFYSVFWYNLTSTMTKNPLKILSSGSKSLTFGQNLSDDRQRNISYSSSRQTNFDTKLSNFDKEEKS